MKDLAFARTPVGQQDSNSCLLGVTDEAANLFVYSVALDKDGKLAVETVFAIERDADDKAQPEDIVRLIWCPYLPDDEDEEDEDDASSSSSPSPSKLLVLTRNSEAEMYNVDMVLKAHPEAAAKTGNKISPKEVRKVDRLRQVSVSSSSLN